ncbi:excinuclease ABC subunit UvrC [Allonocardiopsis opalescens]|uniref:UvrABC system protein C n=1 Tax=Allonocardiopsis opalescens TaxID=1144618 RepID=A0A2T0PQ33_9ACTN|nr:excinuclease ABC subunit UvrC [Allonocardiopsis opalescens]PRX90918.1 excinuclease ABC subunit C [Allonocardiopsis opalescens]
MADPASYRPAPGEIPDSPGVYRFRDAARRVVYVGKAKNLRSRLSSYFADFAGLHPRTQQMVTTACSVEWTVVGTEVEALQLEYSWIKQYDPRFNVRYRDDKSYPYLAVTLGEDVPRVQVMRGAKQKGTRYFGPYSHAWAIRETVDLLLRVFPVRTCSAGVLRRAQLTGRPCLLGDIGKCAAPCVGRVTEDEHRAIAEDFCSFLAGDTGRYIRELERRMRAAAAEQEYERAARLRDDVQALQRALEKQAVVLGERTDCDVIALAEDPLEAAVQVFYVRGGRIRGQRGWVVDRVEEVGSADLVERFLAQIYGPQFDGAAPGEAPGGSADPADGPVPEGTAAIPREVLVPELPPDHEALAELLSRGRGSRVEVRVPRRGDKKSLMETVARNAEQLLKQHKTKRAGDLATRSRALQEIAEALDLDAGPLRIECYDVSNLQGTDVVASMVVFEDGLARKSEYRRFAIKTVRGQDDVAAIREVISRRFKRYLEESQASGELATLGGSDSTTDSSTVRAETGTESGSDAPERPAAPGRFAYPPNLVVVDGGPPQVAAAQRALDELGVTDVSVCGLAKRLEEVWLPGEDDPVILPRASEALYLLQRLRDEAHRFAISYHRAKRSKRATTSVLDDVPGLGPARKAALLKHFGSVRRLRAAGVDEIAEVHGIGPGLAGTVAAALAGGDPAPAPANGATGGGEPHGAQENAQGE